MAFVQTDGSIASLSWKCSEDLQKVYGSLVDLAPDAPDASESQRCSDEIGRLQIWDLETGAREGRLDYALRKSSRLRDGVMELLQEMADLSAEALLILTGKNSIGADGNTKNETTPIAPERDCSTISELESSLSSSSADYSTPLHRTMKEVHEILTCLFRYIPALQDPAPHDTRTKASNRGTNLFDLSHVRSKFPHANDELVNRLGAANWKRRQLLMSLQVQEEELETESDQDAGAISPTADESHDILSAPDTSLYSRSHLVRQGSQTTGDWTSEWENSGIGTALTSLTNNDRKPHLHGSSHPAVVVEIHRLKLPRPPEPNSSFEGRQFRCPYCFHCLIEVTSSSSWKEHVMNDLEPYMCTFGGCLRPNKTYGAKADWIHHEIEIHRTQKKWSCRPCSTEFSNRSLFDDHMRKSHPGLISEHQLDSFAEVCEQVSGDLKSRTQCPLCLEEWHNDKRLRKHLADHLEQIALFAALPARPQLDSDDDLDLMEDSGSDGERRAESVIPDLAEDSRTEDETRKATVKRYLGNQDDSDPKENSQILPDTADSLYGRTATTQFPVDTIRHPPNESFFGRDQSICQIHEYLAVPGDICVVHGIGGVGKTLTTVEYAYRYKDSYDCIFWLQADTAPGLAESYGEIARTLGLVLGAEDQGRIIELSREWIENTRLRWLLIFDNVEDWDLVLQYLPRHFYHRSRGSVLITTQDSGLSEKVNHNLHLQTFGEEDGSIMLLQYLERPDPRTHPERELAQEISGLVGGLPVAISHVAGYVAYSHCSLLELLEIFKQRRRHTGAATSEDDDLPASFRQASFSYEETLAMVWNITLRELSSDARDLLYILAYLNCEAVPESMLCAVHPERSLEFLDSRESIRYKRMKKSLVNRRLIQEKDIDGEPCLYLHRSLQRSIRDTAAESPTTPQEIFDQALILVRKVFPHSSPIQVPEPQKWRVHQTLLPHVISLQSIFVEAGSAIKGSRKFGELLSDAGINQYERGFSRDGLLLLRTAEQVLDSTDFDAKGIMRANINALIALMHDSPGISTRAEGLRRRELALEIRKAEARSVTAISRTQEILLFNDWMHYVIALLQYNHYQKAEPIIQSCLEKYHEWGSPDEIPYEYAKYYHKMSLVRMYQGEYEEARRLCELGVEYMGMSGNASLMLRFQFDLACITLQSGEVDSAFEIHKEVLEKRTIECGKTNENTLHSYYAVGAIHELRGEYTDAENLFRLALDQRRAAYWSNEAVARTQYHLWRVLVAQDKDLEKASKLYEEAKATLARLLPLDYPPGLKDTKDEEALFDHLMTVYGARFTGRGLLELVR